MTIETHPKKVAVAVVFLDDVVVFVVVGLVVVVIVGHRNLNLNFVQNWGNSNWCIVVVVDIVIVLLMLLFMIQKHSY